MRSRLLRFPRALVALALAPILFWAAHLSFRSLVSRAIAYAPNGRPLAVAERPTRALPEHAWPLVVRVGPPAATLTAWVLDPLPAERPVRTIVLLHGVRLDKSSLLGFGQAFVALGYRAVLVDLRGHGESSGTYLTYGAVESADVHQLLDELERRYGAGPVGLFGYSYGGAVALHTAARDPRVRAVVAVAAFATLRRVVFDYERRFFPALAPFIPGSWLDGAIDEAGLLASFNPDDAPAAAVRRSRAELCIIHGGADTQVPPLHAQELLQAAGERAELVTLDGQTHESVLADADGSVVRQSSAWFQARLPL